MTASNSLLALDFDGVLCDSCGESSLSAWKASEKLWPQIFAGTSEDRKSSLLNDMRVVRPVVETGYENMLLLRALIEERNTPAELLAGWSTFHPQLMEEWGLDRADMVNKFGEVRDRWIADDFEGWLAPNEFYPGVLDSTRVAMESSSCEVYIVTTKQARFTSALMAGMAGLPFEDDRIHSTTVSAAPKTHILSMLQENVGNGRELHFVEDKLSTLQKVIQDSSLDAWNLYLVDWGYNTTEEREWAQANSRIQLIGIDEFSKIV
eukprot:CAMPEP_0196580380 /NCGR_PEP_ID=MMETSP1081-20130531/28593_1 /TAXON_ID=36882 /ORGANISM="Pyramimonas amylifera, Strain CCMP720" /LENGTH=263 /DNA_ID=CAMNT_0041900231 /DNA_START=251 /DNA_END=1042 /DNA_ORIENTATION=+